jgi:hypothetical protein
MRVLCRFNLYERYKCVQIKKEKKIKELERQEIGDCE